ncbi:hypothetical protein ACINLE_20480 [Bacillus sp. z60-18]|uniref:YfjL-like protein n=1 Tax=unclassified Bacillus (in: firmicutes) TaxID=185979 RepID=UPI00390C4253
MEDKNRSVITDLLPLYHEGKLSKETAEWLEEQAANNEEYRKLMVCETPPETIHKRMNRKLSIYQLILTAISLFLAIKTSLLNGSFGFILWYTVLGILAYLFYRKVKVVLLLSFVPMLIWGLADAITGWDEGFASSVFGAVLLAVFHGLFAMAGCLLGWLCLKLNESRGVLKKKVGHGALLLAVPVCILSIYNAFNGNPISEMLAKKSLERYLTDRYPEKNLRLGDGFYNFKFADYSFDVIEAGDETKSFAYDFTVAGWLHPEITFDGIREANLNKPLMERLGEEAANELKTVLSKQVKNVAAVDVYVEVLKGRLPEDAKWGKDIKLDQPMQIDIVLDAENADQQSVFSAAKKIQHVLNTEGYDYETVNINANIFDGDNVKDGYVKYSAFFEKDTEIKLKDVEKEI